MKEKYQDREQIDRYSKEIDRFLQEFEVEMESYLCKMCLDKNLLKIPKYRLKELDGQFSEIIRLLPIVMKYKIGLFSKVMKKIVNDVVFQERYHHLMNLFNF